MPQSLLLFCIPYSTTMTPIAPRTRIPGRLAGVGVGIGVGSVVGGRVGTVVGGVGVGVGVTALSVNTLVPEAPCTVTPVTWTT